MSLVVAKPFLDGGTYELKYAVNRLLDEVNAVVGLANEAFDVAMSCDNGYGGVLPESQLTVIDAPEAMTDQLFLLEQALPELYRMFDRVVKEGYACLPDDEFE